MSILRTNTNALVRPVSNTITSNANNALKSTNTNSALTTNISGTNSSLSNADLKLRDLIGLYKSKVELCIQAGRQKDKAAVVKYKNEYLKLAQRIADIIEQKQNLLLPLTEQERGESYRIAANYFNFQDPPNLLKAVSLYQQAAKIFLSISEKTQLSESLARSAYNTDYHIMYSGRSLLQMPAPPDKENLVLNVVKSSFRLLNKYYISKSRNNLNVAPDYSADSAEALEILFHVYPLIKEKADQEQALALFIKNDFIAAKKYLLEIIKKYEMENKLEDPLYLLAKEGYKKLAEKTNALRKSLNLKPLDNTGF